MKHDHNVEYPPTPELVVSAFIRAMYEWEQSASEAQRRARQTPDPFSFWEEIRTSLARVFTEFCTPHKRPYGRNASFREPPEYDPEAETIIGSEIVGSKAHVDTDGRAGIGGGLHRYVLHKRGGKWLIDNVKRKVGDTWTKGIL